MRAGSRQAGRDSGIEPFADPCSPVQPALDAEQASREAREHSEPCPVPSGSPAGGAIREHGGVGEVGPWAVRVTWFAVPLLAAPALGGALADASTPVQLVAALLLWGGWTAGLVATLVPRASSLTVLRAVAPAAVVATVAAAVHGPAGVDDAVAITGAVLALAAATAAVTTDAFVDGSSYGDERRFGLRTPLAVLVGPAAIAWLLAVATPAVGLLLLASRAWVPGIVLAVVGAAGVRLGVPALHRLSRRWLVLVPAGLVVHDHVALPDPVLLRRQTLLGAGPAEVGAIDDPDALDVTLGAPGLVLALSLVEPTELPIAVGVGRRRTVATRIATRVLVAPARPGAFLRAAGERRIQVG